MVTKLEQKRGHGLGMKRTRKKKKIIEETTQPQITSSVDESINPFKVGENIQEKKNPNKRVKGSHGLGRL
jgi:hypothetical protein